jgi:hypothetical protein
MPPIQLNADELSLINFPQANTRLSKANLGILFPCVNLPLNFSCLALSNLYCNPENEGQSPLIALL